MRYPVAAAVFAISTLGACQSAPSTRVEKPRFAIALTGVEEAARMGGFGLDPAEFHLSFLSPGVMYANVGDGCLLAGALFHEATAEFSEADRSEVALSGNGRETVIVLTSQTRYIGKQWLVVSVQPIEVVEGQPVQPVSKPIPESWRGELALWAAIFEGDDGDNQSPMGASPKSGFSFAVDGQSKYLGLFRLNADRRGVELTKLKDYPDVTKLAARVLGVSSDELTPPVLGDSEWIDCRPPKENSAS